MKKRSKFLAMLATALVVMTLLPTVAFAVPPVITIINLTVTGPNLQVDYNLSDDAQVWRMFKLATEPPPTAAEIKAFPGGASAGTTGTNSRAQGMLDGPAFQLNTQYTWYMVANNSEGDSNVASMNFTTHPGYTLTIQAGAGGTITTGTSGNYPYAYGVGGPGTLVDIGATANPNYTFSHWTTSNGGSFTDANSAVTTFTMPQDATTITANFTSAPPTNTTSGGGSGTTTESGAWYNPNLTTAPIGKYSFITNFGTFTGTGTLTGKTDGPFGRFTGVKVDDALISGSHYTVAEGSTIITIKENYLKTLAAGTHKVEVVYTDGSAHGTLVVEAPSYNPNTGGAPAFLASLAACPGAK